MTAKHLAEVVQKVAAASARAGRSAPARLVAVGKTKPVEQLRECYDAGHRVFGENYAQERSIHWSPYDRELTEKSPAMPPDTRWHFIGHLQSNKAKTLVKAVPGLAMIETVDSVKLANRLADACVEAGRVEPLGVMVNTSGEASKHGVEPNAATALASHIVNECAPALAFRGLMTIGMPDYTSRPENFELLAKARSTRDDVCDALGLDATEVELSMGMSGDYESAISMGSDNVRVGSTIFGARDYGEKK
ncbi:uncharacterized protein MICPUCDRAFT_53734 [Micromonas pusilla CCMP1545]|uniref:Pyridoxal phosphate homeostasis protein n=1 Tax=Micromonas pusilla (strain CCMP1545) TaxID=564608 RepID=C1N7K7_MICPC|nr:uncharacterized protein MICPUCDRAFT_53734 [Micromonas pusilla CCMP1545]EEH51541.1 predicted protein [Micromonas pusilla CCMP1545]|eukprot:XP_003063919.1 predicted protein [Micromonas pusilla CCMP1545]